MFRVVVIQVLPYGDKNKKIFAKSSYVIKVKTVHTVSYSGEKAEFVNWIAYNEYNWFRFRFSSCFICYMVSGEREGLLNFVLYYSLRLK